MSKQTPSIFDRPILRDSSFHLLATSRHLELYLAQSVKLEHRPIGPFSSAETAHFPPSQGIRCALISGHLRPGQKFIPNSTSLTISTKPRAPRMHRYLYNQYDSGGPASRSLSIHSVLLFFLLSNCGSPISRRCCRGQLLAGSGLNGGMTAGCMHVADRQGQRGDEPADGRQSL